MEYTETFKDDNGTEVQITMKTDCRTENERKEAISFMAQSSRRFYLQVAGKISNTFCQNNIITNNTFNITNATNSIIGTQSSAIKTLQKRGR